MRRLLFAMLLVVVSALTSAQTLPDFSGVWKLDMEATRGSDRPPERIQPYEITIRQRAEKITIENPAARWGAQPITYTTDGEERVIGDASLGEIDNFARRLRIQATWDGQALTICTTPFGEQKDLRTGAVHVPEGAITRVQIFRLVRKTLLLDTTEFREKPPALIHGYRYAPSMDDGLRRGFTAVFAK